MDLFYRFENEWIAIAMDWWHADSCEKFFRESTAPAMELRHATMLEF